VSVVVVSGVFSRSVFSRSVFKGRVRTLRRSPQSMRRISTASAARGSPRRDGMKPQSVASWSWYSSSHVDLMLISRNRANSFGREAPHPSTMLNTTDSVEVTICVFRVPCSLRGNPAAARRTSSTSSWALFQTCNFRKSCTEEVFDAPPPVAPPYSRINAQITADWSLNTRLTTITDKLSPQDLDPPSMPPWPVFGFSLRMQ
jgi:hypothetical protein